jgi:5,10-methylenetetrahydromethanopterin reductase
MRVGIRIPPCERIDHLSAAAQRAEQLNFGGCWFPDSQLLWRDVFATLAAASLQTEHVRLGTAVTNVLTRHPSVLASAVRTINELIPGRFVLGVGIGDSSVRTIGLAPATGSQLRAQIAELRSLLAGADNDRGIHLRDAPGSCPVLIAATGPRNLELAGEIGDGVILLTGFDTVNLQANLERVERGASRAAASLEQREVVVTTYCHVTDHPRDDARLLKPICLTIAQQGGQLALKRLGVAIDPPDTPVQVYPDLVHAEDWERAVEVCSPWVSDEAAQIFAERACLFGPADSIVTRLRELERFGVSEVALQHVGSYSLPTSLMESLGPALPSPAGYPT